MTQEIDGNIRDLSLRQNRDVTSAQIDSMKNTKKYSAKDLDTFVKNTKDKASILNTSNPEKALWDYEEHKLCNQLSGGTNEVILQSNKTTKSLVVEPRANPPQEIVHAVKSNKTTIIKMNLLDANREKDFQKVTIRYPAGLLDEFISEYQKIVGWLEENHYDALTLDNQIFVSQHEFENAIRFLEKMKLVSEES